MSEENINSKLEAYTNGFFLTLLGTLLGFTVYYSNVSTTLTDDPISNIKKVCIASSQLYKKDTPLMQLTVSQAILESNLRSKPSKLAKDYNNLFGIKGKGTRGSIELPTVEYVEGKKIIVNANFAYNYNLYDSILQHEQLLNKPRYEKVRTSSSLSSAATEIRKAGYATDPNYSKLIVNTWKNYGRYCE